ncbi:hypothetical protein [Teredinibacter turnerae]|uniref:hypothetical protein n=1 Tax=Teredinibacter turnerae TaxID=2426 RepID=UPI00048E2575|nr:hypothetical protein [Teredinibacter turnerae]
MKIIEAYTYRDGGITYVVVDKGAKKDEYAIDYSLPSDGRPRKVSKVYRNGNKSEYEIGSEQEKSVCLLIKELAENELGKEKLSAVIAGEDKPPPGDLWFYVCNFIEITTKEGRYA